MNEVVETATGKVRGRAMERVPEFRTIPYAASTAGAHRFHPRGEERRPWQDITGTSGEG